MKNNFRASLAHYWQLFPWIGFGLLFLVALGAARAFSLSDPHDWFIQTVLFVLGGWLSTLIFVFEPQVNTGIEQIGSWLAHEDTSNQPATPSPSTHSWLRSSTILFILPILAVYLLTSSQSAIGFGFLCGISLVYLIDIWKFTQGKFPAFLQTYFYQNPTPSTVRSLILAYGVYFGLYCLALILL